MSELVRRKDLERWLLTESASLDTLPDRICVVERLRVDLPAALPVAPGDRVFMAKPGIEIAEYEVFCVHNHGFVIDGYFIDGFYAFGVFVPYSAIGVDVFLSRDEAEKALAGKEARA